MFSMTPAYGGRDRGAPEYRRLAPGQALRDLQRHDGERAPPSGRRAPAGAPLSRTPGHLPGSCGIDVPGVGSGPGDADPDLVLLVAPRPADGSLGDGQPAASVARSGPTRPRSSDCVRSASPHYVKAKTTIPSLHRRGLRCIMVQQSPPRPSHCSPRFVASPSGPARQWPGYGGRAGSGRFRPMD